MFFVSPHICFYYNLNRRYTIAEIAQGLYWRGHNCGGWVRTEWRSPSASVPDILTLLCRVTNQGDRLYI
ncbi:MAG: hypothetical protein ACRC8Y_12485 [Chroococcales cyanobacterium]